MSSSLLFLPVLVVAAGVDLHLTLVVLAVAGGASWIPAPPGELADLTSAWVLLPALLLYLAEGLSELHPSTGLLWHSVQALVRPLATAFLALLLFADAGWAPAAGAVLAAGVGAWSVHGVVWGWDVSRWLRERPGIAPLLRIAGRDACAVGLLVLGVEHVQGGAIVAAGAFLALLGAGRHLPLVGRFGVELAVDRVRSLGAGRGWTDPADLPSWLDGAREGAPAFAGRACRVGVFDLERAPAFRSGWLVSDHRGTRFARRTWGGVEDERFDRFRPGRETRRGFFDRLGLIRGKKGSEGDGDPIRVLVVSKRGPELPALARAILETPAPANLPEPGGPDPRNQTVTGG